MAATDFVMPGRRDHRLALPRLQVRPQERDRRQHLGLALRRSAGARAMLEDLDLRTLGVVLEKNGEIVADGRRRGRARPPGRGCRHAGQPPGRARPGNPGRHLHHDRRRHRSHRWSRPATTSSPASRTWARCPCVSSNTCHGRRPARPRGLKRPGSCRRCAAKPPTRPHYPETSHVIKTGYRQLVHAGDRRNPPRRHRCAGATDASTRCAPTRGAA